MIVTYKYGKRTEHPNLYIKYPLHCYIASGTLRAFRYKHGIEDYEKMGLTIKNY